MGEIAVRLAYVRQKNSGYYWEPSRRVKRLGFKSEALGADPIGAAAKGKALNAAVEREERRIALGEAPEATIKEGTVAWLIRQWQGSSAWSDLQPSTRRVYAQALRAIEEWCGERHPAVVSRKAVKAWQRALEEGRGKAVAASFLRVLSRVMELARDEGLIEVNPATKLRLRKVGGDKEPWTRAEIAAVCEAAVAAGHPSMRLAVLLAANLGQREGDIRPLAWSRWDEARGEFEIRQHKTGTRIIVPATEELRQALAVAPRFGPVIVVSERTGRPYQERAFQVLFRKLATAAGLPASRQFMTLRHTMATMLMEAGCTPDEARAITGHRDAAVLSRYARPNSAMARNAIAKLEEHRRR